MVISLDSSNNTPMYYQSDCDKHCAMFEDTLTIAHGECV